MCKPFHDCDHFQVTYIFFFVFKLQCKMFEEDIEILSDYQVQENKILEIVPAIQSYSLTVLE